MATSAPTEEAGSRPEAVPEPPPAYEPVAEASTAVSMTSAPIPASTTSAASNDHDDYYACHPPPAYHVAAQLPSYEEAERIKAGKLDASATYSVDLDGDHLTTATEVPCSAVHGVHGGRGAPLTGFTLLTFPGSVGMHHESGSDLDLSEEALLGNDFMFFTAFITAFLFNWIGFLLLMCFCHTIAARYGALSGFGLSLTKWTLIVKKSTELSSSDNSWLWWLIMAFGLLICVRAIVQYLHIKRTWRGLSSAARERLFFFY